MFTLVAAAITLTCYAMMRASQVLGRISGARGWTLATRALGVFVLVAGLGVFAALFLDIRMMLPVLEALRELLAPPVQR